jgi:hypothetical protein
MKVILFILIVSDMSIALCGYKYLYRSRYLFSDRFGFTASITGGSIVSLVMSLTLFLLFPSSFDVISTINMLIGISVGLLFGAMVNSQSLIAGFFSGGIGGMMGTMMGAIAKDPSICSLPVGALNEQTVILFFGFFGLLLLSMTMLILCFALRV